MHKIDLFLSLLTFSAYATIGIRRQQKLRCADVPLICRPPLANPRDIFRG